jgi:alpha-glucosidase
MWWESSVTYQIYVRSFADSNGDGVGDIEGVRRRLPYIASLGVDAIWLTPFYRSPMADHGYDVADYCDVDPVFGTLEDVDRLIADCHAANIRFIADIVPNHTSNEHAWFLEAIADPGSPMRDRFIFRDPAPGGGLPNNWPSVFGGPAWTLDERSGQYYLHLFAPEQPDLNWRHPSVHQEFERILRFWLDRGVDGFRIDVAHGLYKDAELRDNVVAATVGARTWFDNLQERNQWDQPEVHGVYRRWRQVLDGYPGDRMMVGEVFLMDPTRVAAYLGDDRLHQAFNFSAAAIDPDATAVKAMIQAALENFAPTGAPPTWVLSNHDLTRHVTRFGGGELGRRRARAVTQCLLALPGAPYLYQGEEMGCEQVDVPPDLRQDPRWFRSGKMVPGRDGCRTPMPWTATQPNFGFTSGEPWLPFAPDAGSRNVEQMDAADDSMLNWYRRALRLRRHLNPFESDELEWLSTPDQALAFVRRAHGGAVACVMCSGEGEVRLRIGGAQRVLLESTAAAAIIDGGELCLEGDTTAWVTLSF